MDIILVNSKVAPRTGDVVTYADVNLWSYRGVVIDVGPQAKGGDCSIRWNRSNGPTGECLNNLRIVVPPVERQHFAERLSDAATALLEPDQEIDLALDMLLNT